MVQETPERHRWCFRFKVDGDVRFISHHDTLRLFRRALARADLPVRHSQGFNPHPRLSIPLPRPVGVASDDEALVVEFERAVEGDDAFRRLAAQLPAGVGLLEVRRLGNTEKLQPEWVRYELRVEPPAPVDLPERARRLMESDEASVRRIRHKEHRVSVINVRPFLQELCVQEDGVQFTLRVAGDGTAKPSEIAGLLGIETDSINHRVRRLEVRWT